MSMQRDFDAFPHDSVIELLPWYVNGSLDTSEREQVAEHLQHCAQCQEELAHCQVLENVVQAQETTVEDSAAWMPSSQHLEGLLARLDVEAVQAQPQPNPPRSTTERPETVPGRSLWQWLRDHMAATSEFSRWTLAGQTAVIAMLAVALLAQAPAPPQRQAVTFSTPEATLATDAAQAQVVFDPATTEADMRGLLRELGATIAAGPSELGVYVVTLPAKDDQMLATLASSSAVTFAHWQVKGQTQ